MKKTNHACDSMATPDGAGQKSQPLWSTRGAGTLCCVHNKHCVNSSLVHSTRLHRKKSSAGSTLITVQKYWISPYMFTSKRHQAVLACTPRNYSSCFFFFFVLNCTHLLKMTTFELRVFCGVFLGLLFSLSNMKCYML